MWGEATMESPPLLPPPEPHRGHPPSRVGRYLVAARGSQARSQPPLVRPPRLGRGLESEPRHGHGQGRPRAAHRQPLLVPASYGVQRTFGPTLGHSTSLYEHDAAGATYECGTQAWFYPFVEAAVATLALVGAGAYTWREQRFGVALGEHYWRRRGRFFADVDLHTAVGNMAALAVGTGAVCAIGVAALLPLYLNSGSRYSCQVRPMASPDAPPALTLAASSDAPHAP